MTNFFRAGLRVTGQGPGSLAELSERSSEDGSSSEMKVPPISLPNGMDRLPLPLPFSPDLLWRYPNPFLAQPPPSPLETQVKHGLPGNEDAKIGNCQDVNKTSLSGGLPSDPRTWGRDEVNQFLQYCEKEFDLEKIDMDKFQMNGENRMTRDQET